MNEGEKVLADLKAGNRRFVQGTSHLENLNSLNKLKQKAVQGQLPKAIILCCSDSRAPVEFILDQDIGDLFVIRVAGNIVAPSLVGSMEFAASLFHTPLILVMGHTLCGAISETLRSFEQTPDLYSKNINHITGRIAPIVESIAKSPHCNAETKMRSAVYENVRHSMGNILSSSAILTERVQQHKLWVAGGVLDLNSGEVDFFHHFAAVN